MEIPTNYLDRFKVYKSNTLFEPSKEDIVKALLQKKCPLCGTKLYLDRKGIMWRCKSVRKDKFFIKSETLKKYE